MQEEIIIIGAGPAGLMAAYELAKGGRKALVLEGRDRIGGRAYTVYNDTGSKIETGAEFVHGKLPVTLSLLEEAKLSYTPTGGRWIQLKSGRATEDREVMAWPQFMQKLKGLKADMTLQDFLEKYFPEAEYAALKDRAIGYAEGYDSADASRASAKALYEEWSKEEEEQYRIDKGYTALMDFLAARCMAAGCRILLSHPVSAIMVDDLGVTVHAGGAVFTAARVVAALPLGVLQQEDRAIQFSPAAPAYTAALKALGMGDVIKVVLRFNEAFWEKEYPDLGFLMSGAEVPTWWTQAPAESTVLTGWMAGRAARAHAQLSTEGLLDAALGALAQIFNTGKGGLEDMLAESCIANWSADPYTLGSYAYTTVGTGEALQMLSEPMGGRVFFAGEYMYDGPVMGTVEAAFRSGRETARQLLKVFH